jgi:hypothetical protein
MIGWGTRSLPPETSALGLVLLVYAIFAMTHYLLPPKVQ